MERFLPSNIFLLLKTLHLSEYLTNLTIMDQCLFSDFAPIWWVWSVSFTLISISIFDLIVWITTSSVTLCLLFSKPCIRRQFLLGQCSCLSICCYISPFLFSRKDMLLQTSSLFSFFLILIKLFHNVINWTCQIF